jgi:hypothetical protein
MIASLFKNARQADKYESDLQLLTKLEKSQSQRAQKRALALITSPKGLATIFVTGAAKGIMKPSIARQLKSMAIVLGKTSLDEWLTEDALQDTEIE